MVLPRDCLRWILKRAIASGSGHPIVSNGPLFNSHARAGFILVNINPAYRASELRYTLSAAGIKALVTATQFKNSDYVGFSFDDVFKLPSERHYSQLASVSESLTCHDPINIQFTSGTTGAPKGATLSHRNIVNNARYVGMRNGAALRRPTVHTRALYHCFGMVMGNLACLVHGATMVYPSEGFDPLAVLRAVETEQCTALYGVPTMFIAELAQQELAHFDLSSLRSGQPAPPRLLDVGGETPRSPAGIHFPRRE